jgi:hypothetical protein
MIDENKIVIEGWVGSHYIELGEDGYWRGQFDLRSQFDEYNSGLLDCRADERMMNDHNLGAGIGGHRVRVEGKIRQHDNGDLYIQVAKLEIYSA